MSGVFGYADPSHRLVGTGLLGEMGQVMSHRDWYEATWLEDEEAGVGIGRIGIGIFNKNQPAVWDSARRAAVLLTGEIYNLPSANGTGAGTEQALLARYAQQGEMFVRGLNGSFILALWDAVEKKLILANDRFGTYPLFYSTANGRLVFAPQLKGVLADGSVPKDLDRVGMAQYMRFQQFLGSRTYFEAVSYLPGASVLTYAARTGRLEIHKYWTYHDLPERCSMPFSDAVEETGRILRQVIERQSGDAYRPGIFLSGGLDSRLIAGMIQRRPLPSLTYGRADSRDVKYAARIARVVGSDHHWHDLPDGRWVEENLDFHWALTEGLHSWIHMHSITMLPEARQRFDVNLSGMGGGTLLKSPKVVDPGHFAEVDRLALTSRMFEVMNQKHTWPGLTEVEERLLYTPRLLKQVQGLAFESLHEELQGYWGFRPDNRAELFFIDQHNMRLIHNMAVFGRSHIEFRYPFLDNDLFDFVFSLPVEFRLDQRLIHALMQRELPQLAKIPYDADEFLPTDRRVKRTLHALSVRARRRFNRAVFPLFPEWKTLYADYEAYLRTDLRPWAEAFLFDQRTLDRGIFEPAALRSLLDRHFAGKEEWTIGKIAPLISFEMTLRRLVDELEPAAQQSEPSTRLHG